MLNFGTGIRTDVLYYQWDRYMRDTECDVKTYYTDSALSQELRNHVVKVGLLGQKHDL